MWAAFLALSLSAALQALTGHDQPHRAHGKRLRRELITVPARGVHPARRLIVRLAPRQADGPLTTVYALLRALPGPAGCPFCLPPTRHRHDPDRAGGSP